MGVDIGRIGGIKVGEEVLGNRVRVKVVKNKVAPPFKQVEFDMMYNQGISREGDLIDLASEHGIVEKSGSWFTYGEERIGQGRDNAKQFLKDNPDSAKKIEKALLQKLGLIPIAAVAPVAAPAKEKKVAKA